MYAHIMSIIQAHISKTKSRDAIQDKKLGQFLHTPGFHAFLVDELQRDFAKLLSLSFDRQHRLKIVQLPPYHRNFMLSVTYGAKFRNSVPYYVNGSGLCGIHALFGAISGVSSQAEMDRFTVKDVECKYGEIASMLQLKYEVLRASRSSVYAVKLWAITNELLTNRPNLSFEKCLATLINCFNMVKTRGYGSLETNVKTAVSFDQTIVPLLVDALELESITCIRPKDVPDDWGITVTVNPFKANSSHRELNATSQDLRLEGQLNPVIFNIEAHYWLLDIKALPEQVLETIKDQYLEHYSHFSAYGDVNDDFGSQDGFTVNVDDWDPKINCFGKLKLDYF